MSTPALPESTFVRWLKAVLPEMGAEFQSLEQSLGLEFESGGMTLWVTEHPMDEARLIIEVSIRTLASDEWTTSGAAFMVLHQLNDRARREHDWVITISGDQVLTVGTTARCAELDAAAFQALIADGLDKAEDIQALWADLAAPAPTPPDAQVVASTALRI